METLTNYNLECPTKDSALLKLNRAFGEDRARDIWNQGCQVLGINDDDNVEDLEKIFDYLSKCEGILAVYGLSLKTRLRTYITISKLKTNTML